MLKRTVNFHMNLVVNVITAKQKIKSESKFIDSYFKLVFQTLAICGKLLKSFKLFKYWSY